MAIKDPLGNTCDRLVSVHIRQLQAVDFDILGSVRCTQRVYGRYGIYFKVASLQSLHMTDAARTYFETLATSCIQGRTNVKRSSMFEQFGVQDLASITVFLIKTLDHLVPKPTIMVGCAAHDPSEPAVYLARAATPYDLAHEIGHMLLGMNYDHSIVPNNVMLEGAYEQSTAVNPKLTPSQVATMRRSPYARPC